MLRSAVRTIGLTGALFSSGVFALGLGDMKLFSAVNEPLRAEIKLLKVGDLNTTQVLIKLASMQDFERANVDREFFLTGMRYEVVLDGRGGGVVKVTTEDPVREPYLNFLLEAKWPSGRLIREYTLLLDLPAFTSTSSANSAALQAPQSAPASAAADSYAVDEAESPSPVQRTQTQSAASVAQAPARPAVQRQAEPEARPQSTGSDRYTTQRSDTLWQIAQRVRPSNRVTVNQTMIALQEDNPEAFINGNINRLKVGQVLRIPDEQRVRDVANSQARFEVARQMQEWRSGDDDIRQLDARAGASQPAPATSSENRGTLTLSTAGGAGVNGDPDGNTDAQVNALNARLTDVMAELSSATAENDQLSSRVQELLSEMEDLKNKLELRNSQLAQLQAQGATDLLEQEFDSAPDAAVTPEETTADDAAATPLAANDDFDSADRAVSEALDAEPEAEAEAETPAAKPIKQPGFLDKLLSPLWAGLIAGLLAVTALFFWWRKRNREDEFEFEPQETTPSVATSNAAPETAVEAAVPVISEETFAPEEEPLQDSAGIEAEMGDPIAEADIYVAYGRYPQAVELLNRAIEQEPERTDLVAKLVEVHSAAGDREAAAEQLAKLESMGSSDFDSLAEDPSDVYSSAPAVDEEPAPDVMEEFKQTLPDETSMDFSDEFADEQAPIDETLIHSILGEEEGEDGTSNMVGAAAAAGGAAGASLLADTDDDVTEDDGLSFDSDFDLELELDEELNEEPINDAIDDLNPGDVRDAIASGNELQDANFASSTEVDSLEPSPEEALLADFAELEDQPVTGIEAGLADIDDSMADAAVINELDALGDIQLDLDSDNDIDIESELSSFDVSIADDIDSDIEDTDLSALELELEQSSLESDDEAQRAADIAMLESDETATKLDLARAYIDMGDNEGARDILGEVLDEGTALDKQQAKELIDRIA